MSEHNWCHGTECHTKKTQDRLRGSKGSKVIRTRKVKRSDWNSSTSSYNWFCSYQCQQDFWDKYGSQIRAIAPRLTPLETPVNVIKEEKEGWNGQKYTDTIIRPIQQQQQ
jgi:hypothetical protein